MSTLVAEKFGLPRVCQAEASALHGLGFGHAAGSIPLPVFMQQNTTVTLTVTPKVLKAVVYVHATIACCVDERAMTVGEQQGRGGHREGA